MFQSSQDEEVKIFAFVTGANYLREGYDQQTTYFNETACNLRRGMITVFNSSSQILSFTKCLNVTPLIINNLQNYNFS